MRASIVLLRPSVLFFALALVVFLTVAALNAGESSAKRNFCDPTTGDNCTGGGAFNDGTGGSGGRTTEDVSSGGAGYGTQEETYQGRGQRFSCNGDICTASGGGRDNRTDEGFGGRCVINRATGQVDCTPNV